MNDSLIEQMLGRVTNWTTVNEQLIYHLRYVNSLCQVAY